MKIKNSYSINQDIGIKRISNKNIRKMYLNLEKYIGKKGRILDYDRINLGKMYNRKELGLPESISIYTVRLEDGDIIQVPAEMLHSINTCINSP